MNQICREDVLADPVIAYNIIHPEDLENLKSLNQEAVRERKGAFWEGRIVIGEDLLKEKLYYQWKAFWVDLEPTKGSKQAGTHLAIVISAEEVNHDEGLRKEIRNAFIIYLDL